MVLYPATPVALYVPAKDAPAVVPVGVHFQGVAQAHDVLATSVRAEDEPQGHSEVLVPRRGLGVWAPLGRTASDMQRWVGRQGERLGAQSGKNAQG